MGHKRGQNPLFPVTSQTNIFSTVRDMIERFRMGGKHVLKSIFPQYGHPNRENPQKKLPFAQPCFYRFLRPIFGCKGENPQFGHQDW